MCNYYYIVYIVLYFIFFGFFCKYMLFIEFYVFMLVFVNFSCLYGFFCVGLLLGFDLGMVDVYGNFRVCEMLCYLIYVV